MINNYLMLFIHNLLEKDKVSDRLLDAYQTNPENLSQRDTDTLFKWVREYGSVPMQLKLLETPAYSPQMKPDYSDLKLRAQRIYNYSGSFDGKMSESFSEGMFLFNAGSGIKTATKIVSGVEKVQSKAQPILEGIKSVTEKGLETGYLSVRNLTNAIENTGTRKFALGAAGGAIGETVVESRDYISGKKEISFSNAVDSLNNVSKSGLTGGLTANTNTLQAFGVNVISGVTLKNQSLNETLKENTISFGFSSFSQLRGLSSEPLSGFSNSIFMDQIKRLEEYKIEKKSDEK